MKPYSIAKRLITIVLLVELISAVCVTGMAWFYERHSHFRSFDILLRGRADSLLGSVQDAEDPEDNVMLSKADMVVPAEDIYEVRDEKGRLLGRSSNWEGVSQGTSVPPADGYFNLTTNGTHYRSLFMHGLRMVDPGDKGGGVPRHVTIFYGSPTQRVWEAVIGAVKFYAVASLLLLVITGVAMAWLLHRGLTPLRALAAEAAGVSVNAWHFTPPEEARATKELAPLVNALEATLQGLEHSFSQQRRFISDAAHELKTGVAVVKSSLQLLGMKERSTVEYQTGLDRCEADCGRMEEIVGKMLTLARAESADVRPSRVGLSTDISDALQKTMEQFSPMAELRGITVDCLAQKSVCVALTAEESGLLLSNLLLNALQHSGRGTRITMAVEEQDKVVEVRFEDQGDGISPDVLPHVFERFYRSDPSRNRNTGGMGLGLSICKAIVEAAGGEIAIRSSIGVGTTVVLRLPSALERDPASEESDIDSLRRA